jgi:hypothetical protein
MESLVGKIRFMMQSVAAYTLSTFLQLLYFQILDFYGLHLQSRNVFTTLRPRRNSTSVPCRCRRHRLLDPKIFPSKKKINFSSKKNSGVDGMIAIFCDFCQLLAKNGV